MDISNEILRMKKADGCSVMICGDLYENFELLEVRQTKNKVLYVCFDWKPVAMYDKQNINISILACNHSEICIQNVDNLTIRDSQIRDLDAKSLKVTINSCTVRDIECKGDFRSANSTIRNVKARTASYNDIYKKNNTSGGTFFYE